MNILYDPQILTMQRYGGISRYFYEIICRISARRDVEITLPAVFSVNYYFKDYYNPQDFKNRLPFKGKGIINRLHFKKYLRRKDNQIIHPTFYNPYLFKHRSGAVVSTIHDLTQEMLPDLFGSDKTILKYKEQAVRQSDMLIAISESTKADILRYYPFVSADKIAVVHHGNSLKKRHSYAGISVYIPDKFILFTGSRAAYKNFKNFIFAVEQLLKHDKELNLVCTGGGDFLPSELDIFRKLNIQDRVFHYNASDDLLSYLYSKALCFVFPSLYEGFGLPILEAFDHQCPAILSRTSSFPEIGGDAAIYFDPHNIDDIRQKIENVLGDTILRAKMIEAGNMQSAKFSWDKASDETYLVYKKISGLD